MEPVVCFLIAIYLLLWTGKLNASQIHFNPMLPNTLIKNHTYFFEMVINEYSTNISYFKKQVSRPEPDILDISNNNLLIKTKNARTGIYNYQIFHTLHSHPSDEYTAISFFVVDTTEIKNNIADSYIVENDNFLFQLELVPKELDLSDFTIEYEFDNMSFFRKNYSVYATHSIRMRNVYPITISIYYIKFPKHVLIDKLTTFIFFPIKVRKHITDFDMDQNQVKVDFEVDYNDAIYQNTVPDDVILTAIPNIPHIIVTDTPDSFNTGTSIFKGAGLAMFLWLLVTLCFIVLTVIFGKCQNYFWILAGREIVKINVFGGPHPPDICYLDYWLKVIGHAENRRHCFAEIWEETFNELFPVGICCNCLKTSAKLIFEDRLQELVTINNASICVDGDSCRFPYFQCHLKIHNERIPGFECESCSKEAYITILKWAV